MSQNSNLLKSYKRKEKEKKNTWEVISPWMFPIASLSPRPHFSSTL